MEVYSTEEEQVQAIQQWWKNNGVSVVAGIVIGIAVLGGYRYWTSHNITQAQQASAIYSNFLNATPADKARSAEVLRADYPATPYASLATLLMAKDNLNTNDIDKAGIQLQWVIDNARDEGVKHIAIQRLARVYLSQGKIDSAEALLKDVDANGFSATYHEIRGDINSAKKLPAQARENYRLALATMSQSDQRYAIIKMKLNDLNEVTTSVNSAGDKNK